MNVLEKSETEIITSIITSVMQMSDVQRILLLTYGNGLLDGGKLKQSEADSGRKNN